MTFILCVAVFDGFGPDKQVVAVFMVYVYWKTYLDGLLPPGANGILVVLESTCNPDYNADTQLYTYKINGQESVFLGRGDWHDDQYHHLEKSTTIGGANDYADDSGKGTSFNDKGCRYSIRVYPSAEFEDKYRSKEPWIYTVILGTLFVFTSTVFLVYDLMVEKRQKIVMESALKSGTLVSSLFPKDVRDRLYEEQQKQQSKIHDKRATWEVQHHSEDSSENHMAIASLYKDTTIFFADISGFTAWASKRSPAQVFELLETLYGAFDQIANRRRVFKVETIGGA